MKILVENARARIQLADSRTLEIGEHNLRFEFRENGSMVVKQFPFSVDPGTEIAGSKQIFAQALHYAVEDAGYRGLQIRQVQKDDIQDKLKEILECQNPNREFTFTLPTVSEDKRVKLTIDFTEFGQLDAAKHIRDRAAYFSLLAREPTAPADGMKSDLAKGPVRQPA